ncbi:penicillin-binding protein [Peribacillus saganii]|uniref:Penicillin-binding protein n=1 Tax=Peribacillus saganii TaxID=2303992 RepID=A0A372LPX1_9BACI|nr:transglycosylase domain-containing protein [Peribacillus saganii]RFU70159.1 penicillin-binding protein [Peribacillus saganii]
MRTLLGFMMILLLVPLLSMLVFFSYSEWANAQGFHQFLDDKIDLKGIKLPESSFITAADGTIISELSADEKRIYLPDEKIPDFLKDIFVTIEDRQFYEHAGIDGSAISRALIANSQNNSIEQGGSTITQQLARNLYLTHEKSYNRKLSEVLFSYQLERKLSKKKILELYVNAIFFQNGRYGIESAARYYFGKETKDLTKAELAFLAAIPNNPEKYNPLTHFPDTKLRQERILKQLEDVGKLSHDEYKRLIKEPVVLHVTKGKDKYPDYVTYVESELEELIAQSEGLQKDLSSPGTATRELAQQKLTDRIKDLNQSGIVVQTALDTRLQEKAEQTLERRLNSIPVQGAIVVLQHNTHQLVSLIGGKDYIKKSFNRAFQSYRQPGSSIKPLLVYGPYLEAMNADIDRKISAASFCEKDYCPKNYSGDSYGMVSIRKAFAQSYNTPAVRLLQQTGIDESFQRLDPFHFKKVNEKDHVLSAALGGLTDGVSTLELTNAYSSFHNGSYQPARAITQILDKQGNVLYKWKDTPVRVWSEPTVRKMRILLHETMISGTARKAYVSGDYIGGKTGTTNDVKDLWFVGLTDDYTAGVWIGKDQPASMLNIQPSGPHLEIWKEVMKQVK